MLNDSNLNNLDRMNISAEDSLARETKDIFNDNDF
jgi:hypothetical protein